MLFHKNKVEEDLERIRNSNLSPEQIEAYNKRVLSKKKFHSQNKGNNLNYETDTPFLNENENYHKEKLELEKYDILAMMLAVFSIILPYILAFVAIMCFAVMLIYYLF